MKSNARMGAALLVGALVIPEATAGLILSLSSGTQTITVLDNGSGDLSPDTGFINFFGDIGSYKVFSSGVSNASTGQNLANLNLNITATSMSVKKDPLALIISLIDDTFFAPNGASTALTQASSLVATRAMASFKSYIDSTLLASLTDNGESSSSVAPFGTYSLGLETSIDHVKSPWAVSNLASDIKVPNPGTVALISLGLLALSLQKRTKQA